MKYHDSWELLKYYGSILIYETLVSDKTLEYLVTLDIGIGRWFCKIE